MHNSVYIVVITTVCAKTNYTIIEGCLHLKQNKNSQAINHQRVVATT